MSPPGTTKESEHSLPREAGGFRLLRVLGRGGMGVVYQAEEISSGRSVALKVLVSGEQVSEESFERFRRESRMAASISDSNCVFVYGAHEVEGSPAIAMELCPGETLEHRIGKKQPIPVETAVRWTIEILDGLEAAHRAGVVHRDVKPSNCFITHDDHVKVGDFGLSRSLDTDIRLTQSGAFLGSPLYASPEQVRGRDVDRRSDIYSVGATLYALLGGRAPYRGSNIGEVLAQILSESPPPIRTLRPDVPPELEKVVARAMEREPEKRFRDHAGFRAALEPFLGHEVVAAGRTMRFVGYAVDQVLLSLLNSGIVFVSISIGSSVFIGDTAKPGKFESLGATLALSSIPLLYFALFEGITGASPGKWIFGQRVVDARTLRTSLSRAILRACCFLGPGLIMMSILHGADLSVRRFQVWSAISAVVIIGAELSTMRRRNGFRGLHEFASGTRVVRARSPFARSRVARPAPVHEVRAAEGWPAALGPYRIEGSLGPTQAGTLLHGVDQNLNRAVWIYARRRDAAVVVPATVANDERRALARPARLRWLGAIPQTETLFEIFEAPGGASLATCIAQGASFDWPLARQVLSELAGELSQFSAASPGGAAVCIEQVWIDRAWNPRLLDEPIGTSGFAWKPPLEVLSDAARMLLQDRENPLRRIPAGLPLSSEPVVRRLLGSDAPFASLEEARQELEATAGRPMRLTPLTRAMQIGVAILVPLVLTSFVVGALFLLSDPIRNMIEATRAVNQLEAQEKSPAPPERMDAEDREAREVLISNACTGPWKQAIRDRLDDPVQVAILDRAEETHPRPSAEEVARARERVNARQFRAPDPEESTPHGDTDTTDAVNARVGRYGEVSVSPEAKEDLLDIRWKLIPAFLALCVGVWGVLSTILAFSFRGGLSLRLFAVGVRNSRGEIASRLRCAWRSLIVWLPLTVLYAAAARLAWTDHTAAGLACLIAVAAINLSALAYAIWKPARGIQDKLAGTQLVPR